jgi:hypothetical protein
VFGSPLDLMAVGERPGYPGLSLVHRSFADRPPISSVSARSPPPHVRKRHHNVTTDEKREAMNHGQGQSVN